MDALLLPLLSRQDNNGGGRRNGTNMDDEDFVFYEDRGFWYTRTGQIVRWSIFFGLFFLLIGYMGIGYWHAKRRLRKGYAPLRYHAWLLNRSQRAAHDPRFQNPSSVYYNTYNPSNPSSNPGYGMNPMPPPMYNPNTVLPPTYTPPAGGTKVDPSQWRSEPTRRPAEGEPTPAYEAPSGPPPAAALRPEGTGASSNPYRL